MTAFHCRSCGGQRFWPFVDLGTMPSANAYRRPDADRSEVTCPLNAVVCQDCLLVQLDYDMAPDDLFSDYFYFSSYSTSWVAHARRFVEAATSAAWPSCTTRTSWAWARSSRASISAASR